MNSICYKKPSKLVTQILVSVVLVLVLGFVCWTSELKPCGLILGQITDIVALDKVLNTWISLFTLEYKWVSTVSQDVNLGHAGIEFSGVTWPKFLSVHMHELQSNQKNKQSIAHESLESDSPLPPPPPPKKKTKKTNKNKIKKLK